ncbi:hypothetical protein C5167_011008 [Papaver somniferum]|uniref:Uncharacterized protein n=1 Tax=Papaver somniferum TaxID=3469 RepID=A0A4Y7K4Q7_PAPSO|nr:hypothetical protein C5167_011008 [Papaver somniferum]
MEEGDNPMYTLNSRKDVTGRSNPCLETLAAPSSDRRNLSDSNIAEPTPSGYRRRRYSSLAELVEDFERDRIAGSSFRRSTGVFGEIHLCGKSCSKSAIWTPEDTCYTDRRFG